jgi:hypothetical protein
MLALMQQATYLLVVGTHLLIAGIFFRNFIQPPHPYRRRISSVLLGGMALSVAGFVARLVGWIPHGASLPFMAIAATCGVFGVVTLWHSGQSGRPR